MTIKTGSLSTKYEINYNELNDAEKFYKAINDCKEYLSEVKFNEITELLKLENPSLKTFTSMLSMLAGIEGYPCLAWYQYTFGFTKSETDQLLIIENYDDVKKHLYRMQTELDKITDYMHKYESSDDTQVTPSSEQVTHLWDRIHDDLGELYGIADLSDYDTDKA